MTTEKSTALVARKVEMPAAPIAKIQELRDAYDRLAANVNLITPMQSPDYIPAMHSVSLRAVVLNTSESSGDVYHSPAFLKTHERALTKIAILKLLQAAGGTVVESRRTDDRRDHYVAEFRVVIEIPGIDGTRRRFESSKGVDYRDGSPQTAAFTANQLKAARQFVPELAETKALLRAVRGALALKQKYTIEELGKPFVVPALVPDLDMSDPDTKRMVTAKALGITDALYGPKALSPAVAVLGPELIGDGHERPEPGQTIETTVLSNGDEPDAQAGDDAEMFGTPAPVAAEPPPPEWICQCPCGHQVPVSKAAADATMQAAECVRCAECYPWHPHYRFAAHMQFADMEIKKFPHTSGERAAVLHKEYMERRAKATKGGGA